MYMNLIKKILFTPLVFALAIVISTTLLSFEAKAQADTDVGGNFGIGLMLGEPTGASIKIWNNDRTAFNFGVAWSLSGREEAIHLHADYLLHSWFDDIDQLAFYYGLGGRIIFANDATAGIRVPLGLNLVFENIALDLFLEAAPILDFSPETELAGNGAVGIRYYF